MSITTPDISRHPCFNHDMRRQTARVHLPVAPRCNVQCNFCNRKMDCVNESRPGVTSAVLTPQQAVRYLERLSERTDNIAVAGIAGPGDPMANPRETLDTMRGVRERFPEMLLCVASNGLELLPHVDALADLEVSHVTITINAVDPDIAAKVYAWGRYNRRVYRGEALGKLIVEQQLASLARLKERGVIAKVNSIILPGVNDHHIPEIARVVGELGADIMNCMPLIPTAGTPFEVLGSPDTMTVARVRLQSGVHLSQMAHCARCRADAAGLIGESNSAETTALLNEVAHGTDTARPNVAVASMEGVLVNQHLGEADRFLVYAPDENQPEGWRFFEVRHAPQRGGGDDRWLALATQLQDCRSLLVAAAGPKPRQILEATGLRIVQMEGMIEEGLRAVFSGQPVPKVLSREFQQCGKGVTCGGTGTGCG